MHNENGNQAGSGEELALEQDLSLDALELDAATDELSADQEINVAQATSITPSVVEKFMLRLPPGLRDQIRQLSEQNRRSMNAEIILVLENHIRQQLLEQMAQAHAANGDDALSGDDTLSEQDSKGEVLKSVLEKLPAQKQQALLELLSN